MVALAAPSGGPPHSAAASEPAALEVSDLTVTYPTRAGTVVALQGVSFGVRQRETLAVMGESGCGKSTLGRALLGLLAPPGRIERGEIALAGQRVEHLTEREWVPLRGREIAMVMQDPMLALNPALTIGVQLSETVRDARGETLPPREVRARGLQLLRDVGFEDPDRVWRSYPFQLSGGMQQRACLAIALVNRPRILVADEPTTALDVRVQAQVLDVIRRLQESMRLAVVLITHDVAVARAAATNVAVLYAGRLAELGAAASVLRAPAHPYAAGLLACLPAGRGALPRPLAGYPPSLVEPPDRCPFIPRCPRASEVCRESPYPPLVAPPSEQQVACYHPIPTHETVETRSDGLDGKAEPSERGLASGGDPLLSVDSLAKRYRIGGLLRGVNVDAVREVSLQIARGEVLGLVGASGCGKSTLAQCILRLERADRGAVSISGVRFDRLGGDALRRARRTVQIIFQDARGSLSPRRSARRSVREPLDNFGIAHPSERDARARSLLERVGLTPDLHERRPGSLSSGQCQRVAIARALAAEPDLLVCDEPVSALDLSVQAQILQLLRALQRERRFGMLFISHNLAVVEVLSDRVAVMDAGQIVEVLDLTQGQRLTRAARHPVTLDLLAAVPAAVEGERVPV